jgi:hypothetical protein
MTTRDAACMSPAAIHLSDMLLKQYLLYPRVKRVTAGCVTVWKHWASQLHTHAMSCLDAAV